MVRRRQRLCRLSGTVAAAAAAHAPPRLHADRARDRHPRAPTTGERQCAGSRAGSALVRAQQSGAHHGGTRSESMMEMPQLIWRPMRADDVELVAALEASIHAAPWTAGNFRDSLAAGHSCMVGEIDGVIAVYGVLLLGPGEAQVLN